MKNSILNIKKILLLLNLIWFIGSCDNTVPVEPTDLKGNINGEVFEVDGQTPIEGVKVIAENLDTTYTDIEGKFSYADIPAESYTFKFNKIGYISKEEKGSVVGNKTNSISAELQQGGSPGVGNTLTVTETQMTSAKVTGSITSLGSKDVLEVSNHGHCWSTEENPTLDDFSTYLGSSSTVRTITSTLEDLTSNTQYYVRTFATNKYGTTYSNQITFKTLTGEPEVSSNAATNIEFNRTDITGTILRLGVNDITQYGHVWSKSPNPTINDFKTELGPKTTTGAFKSTLLNLDMETTYYFRAYAINEAGISYSAEKTFTTTNSFIDTRDSKVYKVIKIGNQLWMAENLNFHSTAFDCYQNNESYCSDYGALYTWQEALNAVPEGWHIPSIAEWEILINEIGTDADAGGKMKAIGIGGAVSDFWQAADNGQVSPGSTNESGFTAKGAGYKFGNSSLERQISTFYWMSDNISPAKAIQLNYNTDATSYGFYNGEYSFSVRCVLDSSK